MLSLRTRLGYNAPHILIGGTLRYDLGIVTSSISAPSLVRITAISAAEMMTMSNAAAELVAQSLTAAEYVTQEITVEDSV